MGNQLATEIEIGWLAGIVDGEAWLGFTLTTCQPDPVRKKPRRQFYVRPEFRINNCDPAIIDRAVEILQKIGVNPYRRTQKTSQSRRLIHECSCKNMKAVEAILLAIGEHLTGNKKERSEILLEFIASRRATETILLAPDNGQITGQTWPRRRKPYSEEQLSLVEACRRLQNPGASETTRETRAKAITPVFEQAARGRSDIAALPEKI